MIVTIIITTLAISVSSAPKAKKPSKVEEYCMVPKKVGKNTRLCKPNSEDCPFFENTKSQAKKQFKVYENDISTKEFVTDAAGAEKSAVLGFISSEYSADNFEIIKMQLLDVFAEENPNKERLNKLMGGYLGCYKQKSDSNYLVVKTDAKYVLIDTYIKPLEWYFEDKRDSPTNAKNSYIKQIGKVFKGIFATVLKLHNPANNDQTVIYINKITTGSFGLSDDITEIEKEATINVLVRESGNISIKFSPSQSLKNINGVYDPLRRYAVNELKNINYAMIIDYFVQVLITYLVKETFKIGDCFATTEYNQIFNISPCPTFLLTLFSTLPVDERKVLIELLKNNNTDVKETDVQAALHHIFVYISEYVEDPEKFKFEDYAFKLENYTTEQPVDETKVDNGQAAMAVKEQKTDENAPKQGETAVAEDEEDGASTGGKRKWILIGVIGGIVLLVAIGVVLWLTLK